MTRLARLTVVVALAACVAKPPSASVDPEDEGSEELSVELPRLGPEDVSARSAELQDPRPTPEALVATLEAAAALHRQYAERCDELDDAVERFRAEHAETLTGADEAVFKLVDADAALSRRLRSAMDEVMVVATACKAIS